MKNHKRNLIRLSKKFNISLDESILKFYKKVPNKNIIFSIKKKRHKGKNKKYK